jgi:hypothetical protein
MIAVLSVLALTLASTAGIGLGVEVGVGRRRRRRVVSAQMESDAISTLMAMDPDGAPVAFVSLDRYAIPNRYNANTIAMSLILE